MEGQHRLTHRKLAANHRDSAALCQGLELAAQPQTVVGVKDHGGGPHDEIDKLPELFRLHLTDVIDNLSSLLAIKAHTKGLELLFSIDEEVPRQLVGDPLRLGQVLINLINNACEAINRSDQAIYLTTRLDYAENCVVFAVKDEGVGISEENSEQIRNPFFTTKRDSGGRGLGLSIADSIVREHGGTLTITSLLGRGTEVSISIPAVPVGSRAETESIECWGN